MFLIKYNEFTRKYYKYDTDDHDILTPMFDELLHKQDITIDPDMMTDTKICYYCHTEFPSRNQLFKHLGYHGIDIRDFTRFDTDVMMNNITDKKKSKSRYKIKRKQLKKEGHRNKEKDVSFLMNEMRL